MVCDVPVREALRAFKEARRLSNRALSELLVGADPTGRGISRSHLSNILTGHDSPSPQALVQIAQLMDVKPSYFAEFRLWVARQKLDETVVDVAEALAALSRVWALLDLDEAVEEAERRFE